MNSNVESFIEASEKLTNLIGPWPRFHDAEVIEFHVYRGGFASESRQELEFPSLTVKMILWEGSAAQKADGTIEYFQPTIVVLRFEDVGDFSMAGFHYQNPIMNLKIDRALEPERGLKIEFEPVFQPAGENIFSVRFSCSKVRVLDAAKWEFKKRVPPWFSDEQFSVAMK